MTEYTGIEVGVIDDDKDYVHSLSTKISSVVAKTVGGNSDFDNMSKINTIVDGDTLLLEAAHPIEQTWGHELLGRDSSLAFESPHGEGPPQEAECSLSGIDVFPLIMDHVDHFYSPNFTGASITRSGSTATVQHESWLSPASAGSVCGGSGGNTLDSNPFTIWSHEVDEVHGIGYTLGGFYSTGIVGWPRSFYGTCNGIRIYFGGVVSSGWNVDVKVSMVSIADAMTSSVVASLLVDGEEGWKEVLFSPVDALFMYLEITPVDASGFLYDFIECLVHLTTPCSMLNGNKVLIKYADQPEYNGLFTVSMPTQTSGTLEVGRLYRITGYNYVEPPESAQDDFSNVGGHSWPGEEYKYQDHEFVATGTTPAYWGNGTTLERLDRSSYDITVSGSPANPATGEISANPYGAVTMIILSGVTVVVGDYVSAYGGGGAFFHIGFDFYYSPSSKTILELLDDGGTVRWSNTAGTNVPILPVSVYSVCGQDGSFPAVNAIDASNSTQWKHSDSDPHVIIFDMGDNYDASGTYFYYNGGNSTGWSVVLTMSTTPDNFTGTSASFTINGSAGYKTINFEGHLYGRYAQLYISPIQANGYLQDFGMFKMFVGARVELDMPSTSWTFRLRAISAGTMTANTAQISNISMTGYKPYGLAKSLPYSVPTLDLAEIYYYKFFNSCDVLPIHAQISFSDDGVTWSPFIGQDGTPDTTYTTSWTNISVASGYTGYYFKWRVYFIGTGENSPILNTVSLWLMMILYGMPLLSIDDPGFSQEANPIMADGLLLPSSTGTFIEYNHSPAITRVTSTATAFQSRHKLVTGDYVEISGADQSEYNGIFQVTVIDENHYTYTVTGTPATPATGAISSYPISWLNWAAVTEITRAGTVATVHQPNHRFVTNDWVKIIGADQSEYNGLFKITRTDNNYYTFTVSGSPASSATGSIYNTLHSDWLGLSLSAGTTFLHTANGELVDVIISISISTRGTNLGAELSGQDWEARILPFISTWLESVVGQVLSGYVKDQNEALILDGIKVIITSTYTIGLDKMGVVDSVTGFFQVFVGPTIYDGRFLIANLATGKTFDVSYRKDGTPDLIDGTVPIITPQDLHFWKPGQICGKSVAFVGSLVTY